MKAEIFLLQSTVSFDTAYSYRVKKEQEGFVAPGVFVLVPFGKGNKLKEGVIWNINKDEDEENKKYNIKDIDSIVSDILPINEEEMLLCEYMRKRYFCAMGDCVRCIIPPRGNKGKLVKFAQIIKDDNKVIKDIEEATFKNISYVKILEYLMVNREAEVNELLKVGSCGTSIVNNLEKKGYLKFNKKNIIQVRNYYNEDIMKYKEHVLNEMQEKAYQHISKLIEDDSFHEVLLHGITGSGKTEVYLQLIAKILQNKGNAIVLVPEISLTPQIAARFMGRFGNKVAILHSRLNDNERHVQWQRIQKGEVSVVVGARSAIFAPFNKVDLFIIDEEQEGSYKAEGSAPRYHVQEIAKYRAFKFNATIIYGSATPRVETFYRSQEGEIDYVCLPERAGANDLPQVQIIDMCEELKEGERGIFSRALVHEMRLNVLNKQQTIIFVNRRGFSGSVICLSCGKTIKCKKCNIPMTYHNKADRLICHYCGNTGIMPKICPSCGASSFQKRGCGTQKVEEELHALFKDCTVARMDADTTAGKDGHSKVLDYFTGNNVDFLVGTQMVAKGHDFENVTLSAVISADSLVNMPDYRAEERAFQMLTQVAGRAGRGKFPGRVIFQAYNIDDYAIRAAAKQSYSEFYKNEIVLRKMLYFPPFCALGAISVICDEDREAFDYLVNYKKTLMPIIDELNDSVSLMGPSRSSIPKINDKYNWILLIKAPNEGIIEKIVSQNMPPKSKIKELYINIDINPGFMI